VDGVHYQNASGRKGSLIIMADWVRKALTKTVAHRGSRGKQEIVVIEPNEKLVLLVKFAIAMTLCFTGLEIVHLAFLGKWNSEIFAAISGLSGTVMGIFIGQKT
jgi:hypothetical protein